MHEVQVGNSCSKSCQKFHWSNHKYFGVSISLEIEEQKNCNETCDFSDSSFAPSQKKRLVGDKCSVICDLNGHSCISL